MKSGTSAILPLKVRRSLEKLGRDIALARRKRRLTIEMMLERTAVSKATYRKVERGDPAVGLGTYAMVLYALGFGDVFGDLADARSDDVGLLTDQDHVPVRVRPRRAP